MFGKQNLVKRIRRLRPKQFSFTSERALKDKSISNGAIFSKDFLGNINEKVDSLYIFAVSAKLAQDIHGNAKWVNCMMTSKNSFKTKRLIFVVCESSSNASNAGENGNQLNRMAKKVVIKLVVCTNLTSLMRWQPSSTIAKNYTWETWWNLLDAINHNLQGSNRNLIHDGRKKKSRLQQLTDNCTKLPNQMKETNFSSEWVTRGPNKNKYNFSSKLPTYEGTNFPPK